MSSENLGNQLNRIARFARVLLFNQGELAQLTYSAFDIAAKTVQDSDQQEIVVTYPIGWRPDRQAVTGSNTYKKDELLSRYQFLAFHQLAVNGLVQLVTIMEALFGDVVRAVIAKYPHKLGMKRSMPIQTILESSSLEEVHLRAADTLLNELSYKSPMEFAGALQDLISVNLLECPAFHKYLEIKASRDIFIHNRGIANDIYVRKAATHQRVKAGMNLPADIQYFLESYESCLQVTEWLEEKLHDLWHSSEFEEQKVQQLEIKLKNDSEVSGNAV